MRSTESGFGRATVGLLLALATAACGGGGGGRGGGGGGGGSGGGGSGQTASAPTTVRLGYFPNLTHATALVGIENGTFQQALGRDKLEVKTFNAGPAAVEALFSGALDATYIGPNPAINAFAQSRGGAIRIISGATSGGAQLVVKPSIEKPADLKGRRLATPQRGGTQDVALRSWLQGQGLKADFQGGGDVSVVPQENAQTLETFRSGQIDGAWVPEPWGSRLVLEGGGKVLVDERSLWPGGRFVTTHLIVRTKFLKDHPDAVRRLLEGQVRTNDFLAADPAAAQRLVNQGITKLTGRGMPETLIAAAWNNLEFTNDPVASSLVTSARHATDVGLLDKVDLDGIYDLTLLNSVLRAASRPEVQG